MKINEIYCISLSTVLKAYEDIEQRMLVKVFLERVSVREDEFDQGAPKQHFVKLFFSCTHKLNFTVRTLQLPGGKHTSLTSANKEPHTCSGFLPLVRHPR